MGSGNSKFRRHGRRRIYFFETLEANIRRNKVPNATAYNFAISDRTGPLPFYKHGEGSGVTPAEDAEKIHVEGITIPDFLSTYHIRKVDFINLDCEGSELLIFRDAAVWLQGKAPPIFCEVHRQYMEALGHSVSDAVSFLSGLGYDIRPIQVEDLDTPSDFERCSHIYATHALHNRQYNNQKREIG